MTAALRAALIGAVVAVVAGQAIGAAVVPADPPPSEMCLSVGAYPPEGWRPSVYLMSKDAPGRGADLQTAARVVDLHAATALALEGWSPAGYCWEPAR